MSIFIFNMKLDVFKDQNYDMTAWHNRLVNEMKRNHKNVNIPSCPTRLSQNKTIHYSTS